METLNDKITVRSIEAVTGIVIVIVMLTLGIPALVGYWNAL
jgi:hypothetical protein